jgi:hypothetical protein
VGPLSSPEISGVYEGLTEAAGGRVAISNGTYRGQQPAVQNWVGMRGRWRGAVIGLDHRPGLIQKRVWTSSMLGCATRL